MGCRCSKKIAAKEDVIQVIKHTQGSSSLHEESLHSLTVHISIPSDLNIDKVSKFRCLKVYLQDDWDDINDINLVPIHNDEIRDLLSQAHHAFDFIPKVINKFQDSRAVFIQTFHGVCIDDFNLMHAFQILLISFYASLHTTKSNLLIINSAPFIKISSVAALQKDTFALYKVWVSYIEYLDSLKSEKSIERLRIDRYRIQLTSLKHKLKSLKQEDPNNTDIQENLEYIKRAKGLVSDFQDDFKFTYDISGSFYNQFHTRHNSFRELGALCRSLNANSAEKIVHLILPHYKT